MKFVKVFGKTCFGRLVWGWKGLYSGCVNI